MDLAGVHIKNQKAQARAPIHCRKQRRARTLLAWASWSLFLRRSAKNHVACPSEQGNFIICKCPLKIALCQAKNNGQERKPTQVVLKRSLNTKFYADIQDGDVKISLRD
jgi:hypothetical protein